MFMDDIKDLFKFIVISQAVMLIVILFNTYFNVSHYDGTAIKYLVGIPSNMIALKVFIKKMF